MSRARFRPGQLAVLLWLLFAGVLLLGSVPAFAQDGLGMDVGVVQFSPDGETTSIPVDLRGVDRDAIDDTTFTVVEDGQAVDDVTVTSSVDAPDAAPRYAILAMDTSDSTQGAPRERSIEAAKAFAELVVPRGVAVGVVAFARDAVLVEAPTDDLAVIDAALDDLPSSNATALYDGVVVSARALSSFAGQRTIVVFSDGADSTSDATLEAAGRAAAGVGATVTSVALSTDKLDVDALETLGRASGGRVIEVDGVDGLGAAFEDVAQDLNSRFVLTYPSTGATGKFSIEVTLTSGEAQTTRSANVFNYVRPRRSTAPNVVAVDSAGMFANPLVAPLAVGAAALGLALLLWSMFVPASDRQVARNLQSAIGSDDQEGTVREDISPTTAAMSRRAMELIERVPKPEGYDASLQHRIDQAAWPLRSTEFTTMRTLLAIVLFGLGWSLAHIVVGFLAGALGWVLPNLVLGFRVNMRQNKFMEQLPDTLQLLSGSLKAGYGVLQAIDTIVKETQEPTKSEFTRVLSEARLGLALEDSLSEMAERIGTDDFRWVSVSISIQRRVGGNLAQLLETVAATLRERAATRRQIKALSAEGKLSGVVLVALPFGLAGYLFLANREYLRPLWTTGFGQVMMAGSGVLMAFGILWMKNMIEIDV